MKYEVYEGIAVQDDFNRFDFISNGKNGPVRKRVSFSRTEMRKFVMMKKVIKEISWVSGTEVTYTVSEDLNRLKGKIDAPRKLAQANEALRKLKTPLPDRSTKK